MSAWFPRPSSVGELVLLGPERGWTETELLALLRDPRAEEWQHKVGVAGPVEGSAKPTTRLLQARGWVLKTRVDQRFPSREEARAHVLRTRAAGLAAGVWHAEKVWALLRVEDGWQPLTVCPELLTLRRLERRDERLLGWMEMLQAGLDVFRLHGVGLDLNPANFGREPGLERLYYLDDELYASFDERNLAGALVARIPEEPDAGEGTWRAWGERLRRWLRLGALSWERVADEVRHYPLSERFEASQRALAGALAGSLEGARGARRGRTGPLTCVLADVHANLAALEAVLDDARGFGADGYLFLGDAVGYGPEPAACVRRLAELPRARFVRGNHDHAIGAGRYDLGMNPLARQCAVWTHEVLGADERAWLSALPVEQAGDGWLAVHGAPKDPQRFLAYVYELTYEDNLRHLRERRIPLCFYGHTHVQLAHVERAAGPVKLPGARLVELGARLGLVNPGSVGQPRDGDPRAAYALWNESTGELWTRRVAYDLDRTLVALRAAALPAQLELRLQAGA